MRQRKLLLLLPFHGEQIQRYGALMRDITTKEMERRGDRDPSPRWT